MNKLVAKDSAEQINQYVTVRIDNQLCGIPVQTVRDALRQQQVTRIPLAPAAIVGSLNLRGRIVTVIDMRARLELPLNPAKHNMMNVVVEQNGELYSLAVDKVGDVLNLPAHSLESNPPTMTETWREFSLGIHQLDKELMVILDVSKILSITESAAA